MFRINRSLGLCRLVALLLILLQGVVTANAVDYTYTYKGQTLNYDLNNEKTCTVVGKKSSVGGDVEIPSSVLYRGVEYTVTSIGESAFSRCNITSITLPNTVTSIGKSAFSQCGLTSITLPNSVTSIGESAFSQCNNLTSITLPNSVTSIGKSAFRQCGNLTSITLPNSVKSIGGAAFAECRALTSIILPDSITSIEYQAFMACSSLTSITIPNTVASIGMDAFHECSSLTSITLPDSITSIEDRAFMACSSLTSITIPNTVTSIGMDAFHECSSLTSVTLSNSITSIKESTFNGCSRLTSISIPVFVTSIGRQAFYGCSDLISLTLPNSVISIEDLAFYKCSGLTSLSIPNSVRYIGNYAFEGCSGLTSLTLPNSDISFGSATFSGCSGLTSISIPSSITGISNIFYGCTALKEVTIEDGAESLSMYYSVFNACPLEKVYIGRNLSYNTSQKDKLPFYNKSTIIELTLSDSVTTINENAFSGCSGLTSISIPSSVTEIGNGVFSGCTALKEVTIEDGSESLSLGYNGYREGLFNACPLEKVYIGRNLSYNTTQNDGYSPFYNKSTITELTLSDSVTTISENEFMKCSGLTQLTIPSSVTEIGNGVFSGCTALKELTIDDCTKGLSLGWNVHESSGKLGQGLFNACPLEKVYIGRNLSYYTSKEYGYSPFYNSTITELTLSDSVTTIRENAFSGCSGLPQLTIPSSVAQIGNSVFSGCTALKELTIEDGSEILSLGCNVQEGVGKVGQGLFNACPLEKVYIGRTLSYNTNQNYGYSPFYNKSTITDLTLSDSVTIIREDAFNGCSSLISLSIPESVTSIGSSAFNGCNRLSSVYVKWETPLNIPEECFSNDVYSTAVLNIPDNTGEKYLYSDWGKFKNFKYSDGYTPIFTDNVFKYLIVRDSKNPHAVLIAGDYSDMTVATIPERITDYSDPSNPVRYYVKGIGANAFNGCSNLKTLSFNSRSILETIGADAFKGTGIGEISLPSTLRRIEEGAFNGCSSLKTVSFNSDSKLESIGADAFRGVRISEIILPSTVRRVEDGAFYGCGYLETIELNDGLEYIGKEAFYNTLPYKTRVLGSIGTIDENAFGKDKMLWSNPCKVIVSDLFKWMDIDFKNENSNPAATGSLWLNDELITDLVIPDGITEIKPYTFFIMPIYKGEKHNSGWPYFYDYYDSHYLAQLQSISLPESLEYVRRGAFMNHGASKISIPASVKEIEAYSFSRAVIGDFTYRTTDLNENKTVIIDQYTYLDSLVFDDSFSEIVIAPEAFERRSYVYPRSPEGVLDNNLYNNSIYLGRPTKSLPDGMKDSRSLTFGNTVRSVSPGLCRGFNMEELDLGSCITTIGQDAFRDCKSLSKISFSVSIDSIAQGAFAGCNLKEVILPPTLETIEADAFDGNSSLSSIIMGPNVRKIGENAFNGCVASSVYITAQTPPQAPNNTFSRYDGKLYLQDPGDKSVLDAYYDSFSCWDRFDSYAMSVPRSFTSSDRKILSGRAGDTFSLTATMTPQNVSLPYIFWRSTNPRCATVDQNGLVTLQPESGSPSRSSEAPCKIIAETLYAGIPALEFEVYNSDYSAIDEIVADEENSASPEIDYTQPYEIYNFNGQRLAGDIDALNPGLYIIRQGSRVEKRAIR